MLLSRSALRRIRRARAGKGTKVPKGLTARYAESVKGIIDADIVDRTKLILDAYRTNGDPIYINTLSDMLESQASTIINRTAHNAIQTWFDSIDSYTGTKFDASVRDALGIDATSILSDDIYSDIRNKTINSNVSLINDLNDQHFLEVKRAILADYQGLGFPGGAKSLAGRIQDILNTTKQHAVTIARDQTAKLVSQMAQVRQEDAGIDEYVWSTAEDQRVVGNPNGLYPRVKDPEVHGNHYERNGKIFKWSIPPPDGHPGNPVLCRCIALPYFNTENMNIQQYPNRIYVAM